MQSMTDDIVQRIERFRFPRGAIIPERRNRGYTLYHAPLWCAGRQITPDRTRRQRRSPLLVSLEGTMDGSRSLRSHRSAGRRGSRLHCA